MPSSDWRMQVLQRRLQGGALLCLGTSLHDPFVVSALLGTRPAKQRRLDSAPLPRGYLGSEPAEVRLHAEEAFVARLKHLEVEAIRPDFFGQIAQLLNEVAHCRVAGGDYSKRQELRYGSRLESWWASWMRLTNRNFDHVQDRCTRKRRHLRNAMLYTSRALEGRDKAGSFGFGEILSGDVNCELWHRRMRLIAKETRRIVARSEI